jgi:hypothetical protein
MKPLLKKILGLEKELQLPQSTRGKVAAQEQVKIFRQLFLNFK